MQQKVCYWKVEMPQLNFPVRIAERSNNAEDIHTDDWSQHWHEALELHLVLSGSVTFLCNGQQETAFPGDVIFSNWCIPHRATGFSDNSRYYVLQVDPMWLLPEDSDHHLARYRDRLIVENENFDVFIRQEKQLTDTLEQIIRAYKSQLPGWRLVVNGLFLVALGHIFAHHYHPQSCDCALSQQGSSLRYTREVLMYLVHHDTEQINLDDIAAQLGLDKSYICRLFRQHTGMTIMNYVNRIRCYHAICLMDSGMPVSQAALAIGYNDYNYFSRVFKKTIGYPPSKYVKSV